jgi:hypothetical protein
MLSIRDLVSYRDEIVLNNGDVIADKNGDIKFMIRKCIICNGIEYIKREDLEIYEDLTLITKNKHICIYCSEELKIIK